MEGLMFLIAISIWLYIAVTPLWRSWRRRQGNEAYIRRLGWMLFIFALPFWDYFLMLPAIYKAYYQLSVHELYRVSNARSVRVIESADGREIANGCPYKDALWAGKLDFVEATLDEHVRAKRLIKPERHLIRCSLQSIDSLACKERPFDFRKASQQCLSYEYIEKPQADVLIEQGHVYVTPFFFMPKKQYGYSFWRATNIHSGERISEYVGNFIWNPSACYWFNACRYVVDRDKPSVGEVESAVNSIVTWKGK